MSRILLFLIGKAELPFRKKLTFIAMSVTAIALLISCFGFILVQYSYERDKTDELKRQLAEVLASNLGAAVVFEDKNTADMITSSAHSFPNVLLLETTDITGKQLSLYYDIKLTEEEFQEALTTAHDHKHGLLDNINSYTTPINVDGEKVGYLVIGYRYRSLLAITYDVLPVATFMFLVCLLIGIAVSNLLKNMVFRPLDLLSDSMHAVENSGKLADRVEMAGDPDFDKIILSYNAMLGDIETHSSELTIAMEQLAVARDQAEEANVAKSAFLANMSHELRTPLNAIIGYSEVLHDDLSKAGLSRSVEDIGWIYGSSKQLLDLINGLLDLSKIEAGKMELDIHPFSLPDLLREVEALLHPLAAKHGTKLAISTDETLGTILSDSTKVRQSLLNLGSNACKFTENGYVQISAYSDDNMLVLEVSDTGIGISKDDLSQLFQPFVQSDSSTTRKFGGTGLGLAIVHRFTEMLNGSVDVTSEPDFGTTFTLRLPMNADQPHTKPVPEGAREPSQLTQPAISTRSEKLLALIIEDEASAGELLRRLLERNGYDCLIAQDGQAGLSLAREEKPDLILLDLCMPVCDGWQVLQKLSQDDDLKTTPCIVISVDDCKNFSIGKGADLHLTKPLDTEEVEIILQNYASQNSGRILLVEDDITTGKLYEKGLRQRGYDVVRAMDSQQAKAALATEQFALVITDLMMPECDGFDLIDYVAKIDPAERPQVIVLTEEKLTEDRRQDLDFKVAAIQTKSEVTSRDLAAQISEVINA